jgi:hypothetical protein
MNKNKKGMDYNYIKSFIYLTVFKDQKYVIDEAGSNKQKEEKYYNE